ncbi:uncharacterized protein V1516DRAFT_662924 [Lipomyces oligophaga]|uniref:uncharacterized protein n=1 Tax=Lipomyces oligophaga TaxID=45792 RepID=UPI0034CE9C70
MSRRLLVQFLPPALAIAGGFQFFDPLFRDERDRLISEGVIVLKEELGHQPPGSTPTGDIPLLVPANIIQVNPFEPLVEYVRPKRPWTYFVLHPKQLFAPKPEVVDVKNLATTDIASGISTP